MSNIELHSGNVPDINRQAINQYLIAVSSVKIAEMKKGEALDFIIEILAKMYYEAGQVMPGHDVQTQKTNLKILASNLYDEILAEFAWCRTEELRLCLKKGIRGDLGQYFGLNIATFHKWLKCLKSDLNRQKAIFERDAPKLPESPKISPEQASELWRSAMVRQFEQFKRTGILHVEFVKFQYEEFVRLGLIAETAVEKWDIYKRAINHMLEEAHRRIQHPKSRKERDYCREVIDQINRDDLSEKNKGYARDFARMESIRRFYNRIDKLEF